MLLEIVLRLRIVFSAYLEYCYICLETAFISEEFCVNILLVVEE